MKQRIVGALVLISLAAIIVPIVMDFHKDRNGRSVREKAIGIPPKPKDFSVRVLPLAPSGKAAEPGAPAAAAGAPPKAPGADQAGRRQAQATPAPAPEPSAPHAGATPGAAGAGPEAWDVQVGSFSRRVNAQALRDRLRSRHYTAYVEKTVLDTGHERYRVRVGPELLHADAEKLQQKLEKEERLHGIVVSH